MVGGVYISISAYLINLTLLWFIQTSLKWFMQQALAGRSTEFKQYNVGPTLVFQCHMNTSCHHIQLYKIHYTEPITLTSSAWVIDCN